MLTYQNNLDCSWDLQSLWCALNVVNLLLLVQVILQISWFYIERKEWMASCAIILNMDALIRSRRLIYWDLKTTWEIVFSDTNNTNINPTYYKEKYYLLMGTLVIIDGIIYGAPFCDDTWLDA